MLGRAPDVHCLPVGNAGNITAYWKGYREYAADGVIATPPRMFGFQAAGAAPLVHGASGAAPGDDRHRDPDRRAGVLGRRRSTARDESGGRIDAVTDEQILAAYRLLVGARGGVRRAGVGGVVAGLLQSARDGTLPRGSLVVCTVTGHGLKDPDTALLTAPEPTVVPIDPAPWRTPWSCGDGRAVGMQQVACSVRLQQATLLHHPDPRGAPWVGPPVRVRVPASSANLGPGFDSLGLALGCYDEVDVAVAGAAWSWRSTARVRPGVPRDERHLVVRAMRRAFEVFG